MSDTDPDPDTRSPELRVMSERLDVVLNSCFFLAFLGFSFLFYTQSELVGYAVVTACAQFINGFVDFFPCDLRCEEMCSRT